MLEHAAEITIVLGLINVCLVGGIFIGRLWASCRSAHHRLDDHKSRLDDLEDSVCKKLENTLREAWRFCPLAAKEPHREGGGP